MKYSAPRGTQDVLPNESPKWLWAEQNFRDICKLYGYKEIRTPTFEETELFLRSIGESTDIVTKEMYTFDDRGGRSITLRPEGTAPAVRAYVEHSLGSISPVNKVYYITSIFRYERPQAGRLREHHQFGIEAFGSSDPALDAEIISLGYAILDKCGIFDRSLKINSIGCPNCRPAYRNALRSSLESVIPILCENCKRRFETNPLRILDCKEEKCQELTANAPASIDYLDDDCKKHFAEVRNCLDAIGIKYIIDRRLVRGLDYYTKTAFEFHAAGLGAQSQVIGGGRYDNLVEEIGGNPTPAIGFGMGIERLLLAAESQKVKIPDDSAISVFLVTLGQDIKPRAVKLLFDLRSNEISAEMDYSAKSMKAQMKLADRLGAKLVVILGENELNRGVAAVRDMSSGEQIEIELYHLIEELKLKLSS